jgi:hypothetical protein
MKKIKSFEQFINENYKSDKEFVYEAASVPSNVLEFTKRKGPYATSLVKKAAGWAEKAGKYISGGVAIGKNYNTIVLDITHQGGEITVDLENETISLFGKIVTDPKSFAKVLVMNESAKTNESIDSKSRSKIVVHLKNQGIEHGKDYEYTTGTFLAKNMDVAQNIADAAADKFRVVIYDDKITKDGEVPMMIIETENTDTLVAAKVPTMQTNPASAEKFIAKEDIKGFQKLDGIKKDIEKSKVALEKIKTLIDQGVQDKKLTENYNRLLEHQTNLIKEMDRIIKETKQTVIKK